MIEKCHLCSEIPNNLTVRVGLDERFPSAVERLQKIVSHGTSNAFLKCPECGTFYYWENQPQYMGTGDLDDEELTRMKPEHIIYLLPFIESGNVDELDEHTLSKAYETFGITKVNIVLDQMKYRRPDEFTLLVPVLIKRLVLSDDSNLRDMISGFMFNSNIARAKLVLNAFSDYKVKNLGKFAKDLRNKAKQILKRNWEVDTLLKEVNYRCVPSMDCMKRLRHFLQGRGRGYHIDQSEREAVETLLRDWSRGIAYDLVSDSFGRGEDWVLNNTIYFSWNELRFLMKCFANFPNLYQGVPKRWWDCVIANRRKEGTLEQSIKSFLKSYPECDSPLSK